MRYREEVEEALDADGDAWTAIGRYAAEKPRARESGSAAVKRVDKQLRALINLGVQLGLKAAQVRLEEVGLDEAAIEVFDIHAGYVLQEKP